MQLQYRLIIKCYTPDLKLSVKYFKTQTSKNYIVKSTISKGYKLHVTRNKLISKPTKNNIQRYTVKFVHTIKTQQI